MEKIVYNVIFRSNILVRLVVPTVNIGATKLHQSHLCLRPCISLVLDCQIQNREVLGLNPTLTVLCP